MSSIFGWGADPFGELVDKATSELLPAGQEDIVLNLEVCDQVRAKQVPPKQAMQTIKRRISHKNPNVVLLALGVSGALQERLTFFPCRVPRAPVEALLTKSRRWLIADSAAADRYLPQEWWGSLSC